MKKFLLVVLSCFFSVEVFAFNLLCRCTDDECVDLRVKSVATPGPGTYLKVEFSGGEKSLEGFASIEKNNRFNKTIYTVAGFTLIKQGDLYSVADQRRQCLED